MFHRLGQRIGTTVNNMMDSLRFMPIATRRRIYYGFSSLTAISATGFYVAIHTTHIDSMRDILQMYRSQFPIPVNLELMEHLKTVINDLNIDIGKSSISLFNFYGCDIYSLGKLPLPTGALIGLPFNFSCTSPLQLKPSDLRLLGKFRTKQSRESPTIQKLFNSMILTPEAKKYAIAHQLNLVSSNYLYVKSLNIFTIIMSGLVAVYNLNNWMKSKPPYVRFATNAVCISVTVLSLLIVDHMLDHFYDICSMRRTINRTGPDYYKGAKEYYQKLIERNKALHDLIGDDRWYTKDGSSMLLFGLVRHSYRPHLDVLGYMAEEIKEKQAVAN